MFELGTDGPRSILVAVDGSDSSLRAAAYAAGLARRQHSELVVVFVHAPAGLAAMRPDSLAGLAQANEEAVSTLRTAIDTNAAPVGVTATLIERRGDPANEIANVADELRVDAVVVGSSTQLGHRLIGSIGVHLVRLGRWPVTVVP